MYKLFAIILFTCCGFTLMALQNKTSENEIHQESKNSIYQSSLGCAKKLETGSFQECSFELLKNNQVVKNTEVFISGGMPGHNHGLPTAPEVVWSEDQQAYQIKGLKFSMPGKWVLNFKVNAVKAVDKDIITMAVIVN